MSRRRIAAAIAGVLLLAGCQDQPQPRFEDPPDSPSPSPSETSEVPEAQSPEEFIREWFRLGTDMQNTGETEQFMASSSDCEPCAKFATDVSDVYEAGGFIRIESERVVDVRKLPGRPANRPEFLVEVQASPTRFRETKTSAVGTFPGGSNSYQVSLERRGSTWTLADYLDRA